MGQDGGSQAQDALKATLPAPSPRSLPSRGSVPGVGSPTEESCSIMVCPGGASEAKTLPPRLRREGSPGQLCMQTRTPRHDLASWDEGLVTAPGDSLPGTKTSAREGGPGCSLTLPKVRAPSTPHDIVRLAKRHHSQPQVGAGHFSHAVSIEMGTLAALPHAGLPKAAPVELREEPEKMEMEEQPPAGRREDPESLKASGAEREEADVESKPPTPPLHRFPSWVRGPRGWAELPWDCSPGAATP